MTQGEAKTNSGMQQGVLTAVLVAVVVVALAGGIYIGGGFGGSDSAGAQISNIANAGYEKRISELEASVEFLAGIVASLEGGATGGEGAGRIAFVDMFMVLRELYSADDPEVSTALEQYQQEEARIRSEIEAVQNQFASGDISLSQREQRLAELQVQLERKNLELSAPIQQRILDEVNKLGEERGYGAIFDNPGSKLAPIILFSVPGRADDVTDEIIRRLGIGSSNE